MARPLPNTNMPALAKYKNIAVICPPKDSPPTATNNPAALPAAVRRGNDLATSTTTPPNKNSQMISREVHAVETASTAKIDQSSLSLPKVSLVSLNAE